MQFKYTRIYAGPDGESHFEDVDVELEGDATRAVSAVLPVNGLVFRVNSPAHSALPHTAPRRQFIVTLVGEAEIEASDGEKRLFGPGSILLADDLTGKGHITREMGNSERQSLFILAPL